MAYFGACGAGATEPPADLNAPLWLACNTTDGSVHTRPTGFGGDGRWWRPSEITNMLTTSGWFHHDGASKPLPLAKVRQTPSRPRSCANFSPL
jgi:hypothetical protein